MKQILSVAIFIGLFISCTKTETIEPLPEFDEVSGRIGRIVSSIPGSRKSEVKTFEYDMASRISSYRTVSLDSSLLSMLVASDYFTFSYTGTDPRPASATRTNHTGSMNEITNYFYDIAGRVSREEHFINNSISTVNEYNYYTLSYVRTTLSGISMLPVSRDTIWLDSSGNIIKMNMHALPASGTPRFVNLGYDKHKNPLGETNIGLYTKTFSGTDNTVFNLSSNNLVTVAGDITGTPYSTTLYYKYSTNGYPLKATMSNNLTSHFEYE